MRFFRLEILVVRLQQCFDAWVTRCCGKEPIRKNDPDRGRETRVDRLSFRGGNTTHRGRPGRKYWHQAIFRHIYEEGPGESRLLASARGEFRELPVIQTCQ